MDKIEFLSIFESVFKMMEVVLKSYLIVILIVFLAGCSTGSLYQTNGVSKKKQHKKFNSGEQTYKTKVKKDDVLYFVCSYYGKKFHGRQTANGEVFDMNKFTCAHKTLPFGTILRVTNEDNGKSVVVRVNDRGPFVKGRQLDLSYAAAKEIDLIPAGVKKLKIEVIQSE